MAREVSTTSATSERSARTTRSAQSTHTRRSSKNARALASRTPSTTNSTTNANPATNTRDLTSRTRTPTSARTTPSPETPRMSTRPKRSSPSSSISSTSTISTITTPTMAATSRSRPRSTMLPQRPPRSSLRLSIPSDVSIPSLANRSVEALDSQSITASPPMPATPGTPATPADAIARPASAYVRGGGHRARRKPVPSAYVDEMGNPVVLLTGSPSLLNAPLPASTEHSHSHTHSNSHSYVTQPAFETLEDDSAASRRHGHQGGRPSAGSVSSLSAMSVLSLGPTSPTQAQGETPRAGHTARSTSISFSGCGTPATPGTPAQAVGLGLGLGYPMKQQYILPVDPPAVLESPPTRRNSLPSATYLLANASTPTLDGTSSAAHSRSTITPSACASASTPILPRYSTLDADHTPHYTTRRSRADSELATTAPANRNASNTGTGTRPARPRARSASTWLQSQFSTAHSEQLPGYTSSSAHDREPPTVARSLWKWGFVCPPLWVLGMFMCVRPDHDKDDESGDEQRGRERSAGGGGSEQRSDSTRRLRSVSAASSAYDYGRSRAASSDTARWDKYSGMDVEMKETQPMRCLSVPSLSISQVSHIPMWNSKKYERKHSRSVSISSTSSGSSGSEASSFDVDAEKAIRDDAVVKLLRAIEVKYARRCFLSLLCLLVSAGVIVGIVFIALEN